MTSQNTSLVQSLIFCTFSRSSLYIFCSHTVVWTLLLVPLWFLVLYTGFQRWRQNKRSTVSHSDFFTYHTFLFEFLVYCGSILLSCALVQVDFTLLSVATSILMFVFPGLLVLYTLTCVERYVAVVHPILYLRLKQRRGIWIRNVIVVVTWVSCSLWVCMCMYIVPIQHVLIPSLTLLGITTSINSFCCVQILRALRNPSPGEGHGVSQSKLRAFYTTFTIQFALILWITWVALNSVVSDVNSLDNVLLCTLKNLAIWFQLPNSVVLPLLFLHRAGKLPKCRDKKNKKTAFPQVFMRG